MIVAAVVVAVLVAAIATGHLTAGQAVTCSTDCSQSPDLAFGTVCAIQTLLLLPLSATQFASICAFRKQAACNLLNGLLPMFPVAINVSAAECASLGGPQPQFANCDYQCNGLAADQAVCGSLNGQQRRFTNACRMTAFNCAGLQESAKFNQLQSWSLC